MTARYNLHLGMRFEDVPAELRFRKLAGLGFSARVRGLLAKNGITTVGALLANRPETLIQISGIGTATAFEVQAVVATWSCPARRAI